jgi:hypothetical protein
MGAVTGRRHATGAVHLAVPILAPPTVNTLTGRPPSAVPRTTNQAFSQQDRPAIMQRARPRRHDADQAMGYQYSLPLHPLVTPFLNMNLLSRRFLADDPVYSFNQPTPRYPDYSVANGLHHHFDSVPASWEDFSYLQSAGMDQAGISSV